MILTMMAGSLKVVDVLAHLRRNKVAQRLADRVTRPMIPSARSIAACPGRSASPRRAMVISLFAMCATTLAVVTKLGTLPLSETARVAPRPSPYQGSQMTGRTEHGTEGSINSAGLAALLDKLVAVDLDLSPICRGSEEGPLVAAGDAIARCVRHSALRDRGPAQHHSSNRRADISPSRRAGPSRSRV